MSRIQSKNTVPEVRLRKALHKCGFRYSLHSTCLPGTPDVVMPKYATVVQVRGCFWHGHTCRDGHIPKSRKEFWESKFRRNKARDRRTDRELRQLGWSVLTVWECRIRTKKGLEQEVARIERHLMKRLVEIG